MGDLLSSDERDRHSGCSPGAADEAADRTGPKDRYFWPPRHYSSPPAVRLHPLFWKPQAFWRRAGLPEDVNRHAAAWIPVPADAQPFGFHFFGKTFPNSHRHVFVKAAMVAERTQEKLEALAFH